MPENDDVRSGNAYDAQWRTWVDANVRDSGLRPLALRAALAAMEGGATPEQAAQAAHDAAFSAEPSRKTSVGTTAAIVALSAFVVALPFFQIRTLALMLYSAGVVLGIIAAVNRRPGWGSVAIALNGLGLLSLARLAVSP